MIENTGNRKVQTEELYHGYQAFVWVYIMCWGSTVWLVASISDQSVQHNVLS